MNTANYSGTTRKAEETNLNQLRVHSVFKTCWHQAVLRGSQQEEIVRNSALHKAKNYKQMPVSLVF